MGSDVQRCSANVQDCSGMSRIVRVCRIVDVLKQLRGGMNGAIAEAGAN